jgi:hypothetical protein
MKLAESRHAAGGWTRADSVQARSEPHFSSLLFSSARSGSYGVRVEKMGSARAMQKLGAAREPRRHRSLPCGPFFPGDSSGGAE